MIRIVRMNVLRIPIIHWVSALFSCRRSYVGSFVFREDFSSQEQGSTLLMLFIPLARRCYCSHKQLFNASFCQQRVFDLPDVTDIWEVFPYPPHSDSTVSLLLSLNHIILSESNYPLTNDSSYLYIRRLLCLF